MRAALGITAVVLTACSSAPETPGEAAQQKLGRDLETLFPGIDSGPAAACLRINATEREIAVLSRDRVNTTAVTRSIFERPETLACLQANGVIEVMEIVV